MFKGSVVSSMKRTTSQSKSGAKVEVLWENRSHRCDLFVTCCDLMKIVRKRHKKSGLSVAWGGSKITKNGSKLQIASYVDTEVMSIYFPTKLHR